MNMETIYVDSMSHCHRTNDGTMKEVQTDFFIGKCDEFVEGYCYDDIMGYVRIYPWKLHSRLEAVQREYEQQLLAECKEALRELGVGVK